MASAALHIFDLEISSSLSRKNVFRERLNPLDEYSNGEFIATLQNFPLYFQGIFK